MKLLTARLLLLLAGAMGALAGTSVANADTQCVGYVITAPVIGTRQQTRCVPLSPAFDFPVGTTQCVGLPSVLIVCGTVELHLPL